MKNNLKSTIVIVLIVLTAGLFVITGRSLMRNRVADLCDAIERGDNEEAVRLAGEVGNLNAQSSVIPQITNFLEGEVTTPLGKACETGNAEMILWLLDHGAEADYAPGIILYPLESFCSTGSGAGKEAMQKLLDCGADPNRYKLRPPVFFLAHTLRHRNDGTYPLGVDMVMTLIDGGAEWRDRNDGYTVIHYGAIQRDGSLLYALMQRDGWEQMMNAENSKGQTPLDLAEQTGSTECAMILLISGAEHGSGAATAAGGLE